jgi:hypothetical protein
MWPIPGERVAFSYVFLFFLFEYWVPGFDRQNSLAGMNLYFYMGSVRWIDLGNNENPSRILSMEGSNNNDDDN